MDVELQKPFKLCFKVLTNLGWWQDGNQSWSYVAYGTLVHFVEFYVFLLELVLYILWDILPCDEIDLIEICDVLGLALALTSATIRAGNFIYNLKQIKQSCKTLETLMKFSADDRWKSREKLRERVDFGLKVYKLYLFVAYTACGLTILLPIFLDKLPWSVWLPSSIKENLAGFWIASLYFIGNSVVAALTDMTLAILPVIFMTFAIGFIEELTDRLEMIGKDEEKTKEFIKCVEIQIRIKAYVAEIQDNFSTAIFIQGLLGSVILCMNAFTMTMVSRRLHVQSISKNFFSDQVHDISGFIKIFAFMFAMIIEIFLPCYFGNELSLASSKLSTAMFHSNWIDENRDVKVSMLVLMENLKQEMTISAFEVFQLNLETFTTIANSAYSLFAVLKKD
jgi:odorant receptor